MPQYLAPGVYVEEIPGPRTIQGVSTSMAAFVGPSRFGPTSGRPELLTSYLDFGQVFGDAVDLDLRRQRQRRPTTWPCGVKGFFDEGGSQPVRGAHLRVQRHRCSRGRPRRPADLAEP